MSESTDTFLRTVGITVAVMVLFFFGRILLATTGVLLKFLIVPVGILAFIGLLYAMYTVYSNAPPVYETGTTGIETRRTTRDATETDDDCFCGDSSDTVRVTSKEVVLNGRAVIKISKETEPLCSEDFIEPDEFDSVIDRELETEAN